MCCSSPQAQNVRVKATGHLMMCATCENRWQTSANSHFPISEAHLGTPSCTRDNRPPAPEPSLHPGGQNREWKHVKDFTGITRVYETYVSWDGRMLTEEQTLDWDPGIIECGCTAKLKVLRYVKRQEWKKYVRWIWILLISTVQHLLKA